MGVDWTPARVRAGVDANELAALIAEDARLNHLHGRGADFAPGVTWQQPAPELTELWHDTNRRLRACLEIPVDGEGYWYSFRVAVIARNPCSPRNGATRPGRPCPCPRRSGSHPMAPPVRRSPRRPPPHPAEADLEWAGDFFTWVRPWIDDCYGLYLWS